MTRIYELVTNCQYKRYKFLNWKICVKLCVMFLKHYKIIRRISLSTYAVFSPYVPSIL